MSERIVVRVERLRKTYGHVVAVDEVSFEIREGEIFGMVGPNGAGKTTTIECVEGLRRPDSGTVQVLGHDPLRSGYLLRQRIGIQLQESALPARIKAREALSLFASFYPRGVDQQTLIEQLGLGSSRDVFYSKLSGGQKQRLFIALALIHDPELVFLDELTTGLDPQARRAMWELIEQVRARGKTVFLTTHFMEEAERLCDRVAIIDHGRIVALDAPASLVRNLGVENRVVFMTEADAPMASLADLPAVERMERSGDRCVVYGHGDKLVVDVVNFLATHAIRFHDLRTEQPNLDDVFLALTGREMRD